jgi:Ankyrin repeats (3 copies)
MTLLRLGTLALFAFSLLFGDDINDDLLAATRKGDLPAVKALLDKGADVNAKSPYGSTPLFFACDRGHTEIIKLLLDRGADVNVEDTFYHATALTWAIEKKRIEIVKILLDHGAKSPASVLMSAIQEGNPQLAKVALDKGGINKLDLSTALGMATRAKKTDIVDMLAAAGAEPIKTIQLDEATLAAYTGAYSGGRGGTEFDMTVAVKNGNLSVAIAGQGTLTFAALDKTHFQGIEMPAISLEFIENGFHFTQSGNVLDFKRKAPSK